MIRGSFRTGVTSRGIILVIIGCIIAILILSLPSFDINYSISINQSAFPQGENTSLAYEINNGLEEVHQLKFIYTVRKNDQIVVNENVTILGSLKILGSIKNNILLETYNLPPGNYVIRTEIEYTKGTGKNARTYQKILNLECSIY